MPLTYEFIACTVGFAFVVLYSFKALDLPTLKLFPFLPLVSYQQVLSISQFA